jgi:predicted CDP-diglyceride synthetase/phosphatidate cytidylyltransferase
MLEWAKALIGALLTAIVGFCGGIAASVVRASWNDLIYLAEKNGALDAFNHLSALFGGLGRH